MKTSTRVVGFVVGLAVIFGAAFGIGRVFEDSKPGRFGIRLLTTTAQLTNESGVTPLRFEILDPTGSVQTRFVTERERDLHLIVVSHDLGSYQHLHPVMAKNGTWTVDAATTRGRYRIFADFRPRGGSQQVLHRDVLIGGPGAYAEMRQEGELRDARVDGYGGQVSGDLVAGGSSVITIDLKGPDVRPLTDLQPYLGAYGHLVVIKDKGLDYVHAHAEKGPAGPRLTFHVTTPGPGQYHLFLDFKHGGVVRTLTAILVARAGSTEMDDMPGMDHGDH